MNKILRIDNVKQVKTTGLYDTNNVRKQFGKIHCRNNNVSYKLNETKKLLDCTLKEYEGYIGKE